MVSSFVQGKYYGLLMTVPSLANTGSIVNFFKATGFNPNVDNAENAYIYTGSNEAYSRDHIVSMEVVDASTLRFNDDTGNGYFDINAGTKIGVCFIFNSNTGSYSDFSTDAFLIESVLMIYDKLNSMWVKAPHVASGGYSGTSTTAVDSGRNANGVVIGQVIRSDIAKVEARWNYLTVEQYSALAKLFEMKYGGDFFVNVCFFDSVAGGFDCSRVFYCGDRKVTFARIKCNQNYMPVGYESVGLNLIEK